MWLSIVSPAPTTQAIAGFLWGLTQGFTEYCVSADQGPTPGLCWEIFPSKGQEIYPEISAYAGTLTKVARGYGAGNLQENRNLQEKCPPQSRAMLYLGCHKVQN